MVSPQISRNPSGTGVCLVQLRALFVPRVSGRRAVGASGVGKEQRAAEAERVGAWRGAQGGEVRRGLDVLNSLAA